MTRYQALRAIGCDPLAAGAIAAMNWIAGIRRGQIRFLSVVIEYEL